MNILFNLFSSVIIPGIIWDILKTGSEYSLKNIIEKFSKWNISDKEAEEIRKNTKVKLEKQRYKWREL